MFFDAKKGSLLRRHAELDRNELSKKLSDDLINTLSRIPKPNDLIALKSVSIPGNFAYKCDDCGYFFNYRYTKSCPSCGSNHSTHASLAYHKQADPVKPL